jgi:hypothetical protein
MTDDGGVDLVEPMDINNTSHQQIGTYLDIPSKYYRHMQSENPELLAHNVNDWFHRKGENRMLRTLDGTARAFLSERYKRIDNLQIIEAVMPIIGRLPDVRFESCQITDNKMYIKAVNPRLEAEVVPGDIVQAGIVISNSETGEGSFCVQPLIYRLICTNGMVVNEARTRRIHRGSKNEADDNYIIYSDRTLQAEDRAFMLKVQDTVRAAVDSAVFGRVVDKMRGAKDARMNTTDIPAVVKLANSQFHITEDESEFVLNHFIEDKDYSLYGLANAVTRYSQDVEDYTRASDLENIGYNILTMDPQLWNRLNLAA